jgi:DNA-binding LacI/PurR family transcriptional regulator
MPTIYDVAREAGVSIGTVSYVINKSKQVRPQTVRRVEDAMRKLNYLPSASAKALALGRTDVVSLIYPNNIFNFQMVLNSLTLGIAEVLADTDYRLTLLPLLRETDIQELEANVQAHTFDGAILMNTLLHDPRVGYLKQVSMPFVQIGRCLDNEGLYFVDADIEAAARLQVEHLVNLGHRSIAFLGFQPVTEKISSVAYRLQTAFQQSLADFGLPDGDTLFIENCPPTEMVSQLKKLLTSPHPPTAISASNEAAVMCILKTTSLLGLRIPQDIAVIGYADSPLYPLLTPPISIVFNQIIELGVLSAQMLLTLMDGRQPDEPQILLEPHLAVRPSTFVG